MSSPDDNMRLCSFSFRVRAFILQKIACALLRFLLTKQHSRRARLDVPMPACISSTMPPCGRAAVCASCFDPSFFGIVNFLRAPCCGNAVLLAPCAIHRCAGLLTCSVNNHFPLLHASPLHCLPTQCQPCWATALLVFLLNGAHSKKPRPSFDMLWA